MRKEEEAGAPTSAGEAPQSGENVAVNTSSVASAASEAAEAGMAVVSQSAGNTEYHKEKEPDVPKFDGRDAKEYRTYKKKVQIWQELTATPAHRQALRLLTGLEGEAWTAAEDLDFEKMKTDEGPRLLEARLDELMGIQRESEMMKVIDDFYFAEPRRDGEEIRSYLNRMRQNLAKLKGFSVEPPTSVQGRILLRHAQLADEDESLVLTASGQKLDYESIEEAMNSIWGTDKRKPRRRGGNTNTVRRSMMAEELASEDGDDEDDEDSGVDQAMAAILEEEDSAEESLSEGEATEVLLTWKNARDKLKEKTKARKFHPKKSTPPAPGLGKHFRGTFDIEEVKRRTRCAICKKKGHWKKECPDRATAGKGDGKDKRNKNKTAGGSTANSSSGFFAFAEE